jgi:hypothetical protein
MRSLATLEDGTVLFAPRGELPYDPVADLVECHLCGEWYRALGPHLRRHGWTADEHRLAVGLSPRRPLPTPSVSEPHAAIARALLDRDPRVRAGLAAGVERARSGELPAVMSRALARTQLLELRRRQGRELGRRRAEAFRARRELRATELGYRDLATYLRQRYTADGARVEDLARELDVALSAVVAEMDRAGIPRRPRGDGLRADTRQRRARLAAR